MAAPTEHFREQAALTRVDRASSSSEKTPMFAVFGDNP
jgi:hypothetical protein